MKKFNLNNKLKKWVLILNFIVVCSFFTLEGQIPAKIWDKDLGAAKKDALTAIVKTADGNYLLGGNSESHMSISKSSPSKGKQDYWIVKISPTGNKIWDQNIWRECRRSLDIHFTDK